MRTEAMQTQEGAEEEVRTEGESLKVHVTRQLLVDLDGEQLCTWLRNRNIQFTLIYKASVNGFDPAMFHRLCDGKGATMSIGYAESGYVFGGYTQVGWTSHRQTKPDMTAFLFRLYSGSNKFDPFVRRTQAARGQHQQSQVFHKPTYGPAFGASGSNLSFFNGTHQPGEDGFTKTNGFCQPGCTGYFDYEKFEPHDLVGPGGFKLKDIEVYQVIEIGGQYSNTSPYHKDSLPRKPGTPTHGTAASQSWATTTVSAAAKQGQPRASMASASAAAAAAVAATSTSTAPSSRRQKPLLTELEAWRKITWDEQTKENLKQEIANHCPLECLEIKQFNILLLGQIGAGKSSFFNTINSVFRGHVTGQANMGSAWHSLTTKFRMYEVRSSRGGDPLNFRLCDTMGIEQNQGLNISDIPYILDGNVHDRHQFNPAVHITHDLPGFNRAPGLASRMHCVVFVVDCCMVTVMSQRVLEKYESIREHVNQRGIPLLILLTKVDKACAHVSKDLTLVYRSTYILQKIEELSFKLGVPRSSILPVKNYESELELDTNIDILALTGLRQMFRYADNYLDDQLGDEAEANVEF